MRPRRRWARRSASCARASPSSARTGASAGRWSTSGIAASLVGVLGVLGPEFAKDVARARGEGLRGRRPAARLRHRDGHPVPQQLRAPACRGAGIIEGGLIALGILRVPDRRRRSDLAPARAGRGRHRSRLEPARRSWRSSCSSRCWRASPTPSSPSRPRRSSRRICPRTSAGASSASSTCSCRSRASCRSSSSARSRTSSGPPWSCTSWPSPSPCRASSRS